MLYVALFFIAYGAMLPMVALQVLFNWKVVKMEGYTSLDQLKKEGPRVEAYTKTMPVQPLYNILTFGFLSWVFIRPLGLPPLNLLGIGLFWLLLAAVTDLLTWVVWPHPWRLSSKELYLGHQPWLTLCYLCIIGSPFIALV